MEMLLVEGSLYEDKTKSNDNGIFFPPHIFMSSFFLFTFCLHIYACFASDFGP